jgi:hypothetical protein
MEYLSEKYGLVTDNDPVTENGQLFLEELRQLTPEDKSLNELMNTQLLNSRVESGLYHRNPELSDRRCMSHDNLEAIFAYSFSTKTPHRFTIWSYLLWHCGTYDNTKGKTSQFQKYLPFNPSNFFIWGLCAESKIYLLFFPLFLITLVISCNKPVSDTSGKILSSVGLTPHKDHWIVKYFYRYYEKKMKAQYGDDYLKKLLTIYHGSNSTEFPILKVLNKE